MGKWIKVAYCCHGNQINGTRGPNNGPRAFFSLGHICHSAFTLMGCSADYFFVLPCPFKKKKRTGGEKWVHFEQKPTSVSVHWMIDSGLGTKGNDWFGLKLFSVFGNKTEMHQTPPPPLTELIEMVLQKSCADWFCLTRHTIYTF